VNPNTWKGEGEDVLELTAKGRKGIPRFAEGDAAEGGKCMVWEGGRFSYCRQRLDPRGGEKAGGTDIEKKKKRRRRKRRSRKFLIIARRRITEQRRRGEHLKKRKARPNGPLFDNRIIRGQQKALRIRKLTEGERKS